MLTKKTLEFHNKCENCDRDFISFGEEQRFCSQQCISENGFKAATAAKIEETQKRRAIIRELVLKWALNNKETILKCPRNKISTNLTPLLYITKISDWRTLTLAVCNSESRKDMLDFLINYVKIYADPDLK